MRLLNTTIMTFSTILVIGLTNIGTVQARVTSHHKPVTPVAAYVLKHPKREHCRVHYTKKVEHPKVQHHGRTYRVKKTFCVRVTPARPIPPVSHLVAPTISGAPTVAISRLHAHLDPSFAQSPTNPFSISYKYGASVTSGTDAVSLAVQSLPEGILNLYSDGSLVCSTEVGGTNTESECNVSYTKLGEHTVVVTYAAGETSATETSTEKIEPFPTTTSLILGTPTCGEQEVAKVQSSVCSYPLNVSVTNAFGSQPPTDLFSLFGLEKGPKGGLTSPLVLELRRTINLPGEQTCSFGFGTEMGGKAHPCETLTLHAESQGVEGWLPSTSSSVTLNFPGQ